MKDIFGTEFRQVELREHLGKPAIVGIAIRVYDTTVEDLWDAIVTPERLARWFLKVEGDLRLGGRYQLQGNASGTITRCERPEALDLTWEFGGGTSWVNVRLSREKLKARLTLEHIAHKEGIGKEHFEKFGPGATGVGWDLALHGLKQHLSKPDVTVDPAAVEAWTTSSEGKAFIRESGEAWGDAYIATGAAPEEARAQAQRTIAFYTGA